MRTILILCGLLMAATASYGADEFQYFRHYDFSGGGNWATSAFTMPDNECPDICNMIVTEDGALEKRNGYHYHSSFAGGSHTTILPHSLFRYYPTNASAMWLAHAGTCLYKLDESDDTWDTIETGLSSVASTWVSFRGKAFVTNKTDGLRGYDGTTVTNYTLNYGAPRCDYAAVYGQRLFLAGSAEVPLMVFYSDLLNPNLWVGGLNSTDLAGVRAGYWELSSGDNGAITGIVPWRDYLAIFTYNTIHLLNGDYPSEVSISQLSGNIGCSAPRSITKARQEVLFKYNEHVYTLADPPEPISLKLGTQLTSATNCVGLTYKRYFFMSDPGTDNHMGSTESVFIFDMDKRVWTKYDDIPLGCAYTATGTGDDHVLLIGDSERDRVYIWQEDHYLDDLGRNDRSYASFTGQYPCWYLTKQFAMDTPEHFKKFRSLQIDTYASSGDFNIYYYIDYDRIQRSFSYILSELGLLDHFILDTSTLSYTSAAVVMRPFLTDDGGKFIQLKFYNLAADQQIKFSGFSLRWLNKQFRGGI